MASGRYKDSGISEEDQKLLEAFHAMEVKPEVESSEDLVEYMRSMGRREFERTGLFDRRESSQQSTTSKAHHFPKISMFYGEENKGEVNWQTYKFEVAALLEENAFTKEQILLGIRRSAKGNAGDVIRRLGIGAGIKEVLEKLESTFGNIESEEVLLRKFYACQQDDKESVVTYASRVEEIFARAVATGIMLKSNDKVLKKVFYQGLKTSVKQIAYSKCDIIHSYDEFKFEVRKIEADLATPTKVEEKKTQCGAAVYSEKTSSKSELTEVKELLKKMNERLERLENEKTEPRNHPQTPPSEYYRGRGQSQYRGRGGRGNFRRPTGYNTMQPRCFNCNRPGHFIRDCRDNQVHPNDQVFN